MDDYKKCIVEINLFSILSISLGTSAFLGLEVFSKLSGAPSSYNNDEIKEKCINFFKDYSNLKKFKTESQVVKYLARQIYPLVNIVLDIRGPELNKLINNRQEFNVNLNNMNFFLDKIWPVILKNIFYKNIYINDYVNTEKHIAKISIQDSMILKNYPEGTLKEDAIKCFTEDLQKILYYNALQLKSIDFNEIDGQNMLIISV